MMKKFIRVIWAIVLFVGIFWLLITVNSVSLFLYPDSNEIHMDLVIYFLIPIFLWIVTWGIINSLLKAKVKK